MSIDPGTIGNGAVGGLRFDSQQSNKPLSSEEINSSEFSFGAVSPRNEGIVPTPPYQLQYGIDATSSTAVDLLNLSSNVRTGNTQNLSFSQISSRIDESIRNIADNI